MRVQIQQLHLIKRNKMMHLNIVKVKFIRYTIPNKKSNIKSLQGEPFG